MNFLKSKVWDNNKVISSNRKIATNCDSGVQPTHLGYDNSQFATKHMPFSPYVSVHFFVNSL